MAAMISQDPVILTNQENSWLHVHRVFETQIPDLSNVSGRVSLNGNRVGEFFEMRSSALPFQRQRCRKTPL